MAFPQNFIDELTARNDIVDVVGSYVSLSQKAGSYWACCPFHNEKTPSFHVVPDKQICHCFGCHKGGGVINFVMEMENLSYPDAIRFLAKRVNMQVPEDDHSGTSQLRQRILSLNTDAARYFYDVLQSPQGEAVRAYLDKRKISKAVARNFGMGASLDSWDGLIQAMTKKGYTKNELLQAGLCVQNKNGHIYDKFRNRLMLPVIDVRGDVVGFGSRVIDNSEPKYMNTTDTITYSKRRILYGLNLAKKTKRPNFILCEGNLDVVTLHQAGFDNAVASMGTALTDEQIRLLAHYTNELILCYDNDAAGQAATQRALEMLDKTDFKVRVLKLPNKMVDGVAKKQDADDFIKLFGPDAFENLLNGSENGIEFRILQIANKYNLKDPTQCVSYAKEVCGELSKLKNAVERDVYTVRAAEMAGITPQALRMDVQRAVENRARSQKRQTEHKEMNPAVAMQPEVREMRYKNLRSARAEEEVLRIFYCDDSVFNDVPPISAEDFSSENLGNIFAALCEAKQQGVQNLMSYLAGTLSRDEVSLFTTLIEKPISASNLTKALSDCVEIIGNEKMIRDGYNGIDPLIAARMKNEYKKTYGGKPT